MCVCVCVCVCARARARTRVRVILDVGGRCDIFNVGVVGVADCVCGGVGVFWL